MLPFNSSSLIIIDIFAIFTMYIHDLDIWTDIYNDLHRISLNIAFPVYCKSGKHKVFRVCYIMKFVNTSSHQ